MTEKIDIDKTNLEDMIRAACANGDMTHLSVAPVAGKGPNNVVWSASFSPASRFGSGFGRDADPVRAMKLAMTDTRLGSLVTDLRKTVQGGKPKFPVTKEEAKAAKETLDRLPPEVDDSDFA